MHILVVEDEKKVASFIQRGLESANYAVDVERDGFLATMDISCWSFLRMAHLAEPLMKKGGTLFTMTFYGSQMVVENYNIMGVAKAALESAVRYVAAELGPKGIRVHAVSPGPLATRAAISGSGDLNVMLMTRLSPMSLRAGATNSPASICVICTDCRDGSAVSKCSCSSVLRASARLRITSIWVM